MGLLNVGEAFLSSKFDDALLATQEHPPQDNLHNIQINTNYETRKEDGVIISTINQQMHLYNFHLKHFKTQPLRHVSIFQIIIREFRRSLLKLLHIHDLVHNMICCHNTLFTKTN